MNGFVSTTSLMNGQRVVVMDDCIGFAFSIAVICAALAGLTTIMGDTHFGTGAALQECEVLLPRNEDCKLIAVPEGSTDG